MSGWRRRIKHFFSMGLTPKSIARSASIAAIYSIIPIFGISKIMTTLTGIKFKYNLPLMYTVGYIFYPLQFILFIPFLRLGEWILQVEDSSLVMSEFKVMVQEDLFHALWTFSAAFKYAMVGWGVLFFPALILLNGILLFILNKIYKFERKTVQHP
ncbi:MAG: DUF2062 domain-containing protein [Chitinophagales bacterium]|nr:DUF2062 domain-containing protein [Chitinophagales bacterium]